MKGQSTIVLRPAETLRYQLQDSAITKIKIANRQSQDYKNGLLEFDNTTLEQVLYRIERTNAVQVTCVIRAQQRQ